MSVNFTPLALPLMLRRARRTSTWRTDAPGLQREQLRYLLRRAADTETGRRYAFAEIARAAEPEKIYSRRVPLTGYEEIRPDVMRMIAGERDVLWPGRCRSFAQSSGTSGGKSKYIPVTDESLRINHYPGAADTVAHYLEWHPGSRLFAGKGLILGGSFANELNLSDRRVKVGDLSATLISRINPLANLARVPSKRIALMQDWESKLPAITAAAAAADVTNISGVPSWMLVVLRKILADNGASSLEEVWPNIEVFFHGGISFAPYREEYRRISPAGMTFVETYNASEGFFATQDDPDDRSMLLIMDGGIYYEFIPLSSADAQPTDIGGLTEGETYEMVISGPNGLWRYRIGDTVRVECAAPVKITIAGRTRSFINAFGEELMENNADYAIAEACRLCSASIRNYTAAPVFAADGKKGRHEWLVEWLTPPADTDLFAAILDEKLRGCNSDYDAKRTHSIFLDPPSVLTAPAGLFDRWLRSAGNHKLGGQRKVPRLSNDRRIMEELFRIKDRL